MSTSRFGALVLMIAGASFVAIDGNALAQSGKGSASGTVSGMTSQGLASEPSGIGEKGTGQTQSAMERSGQNTR